MIVQHYFVRLPRVKANAAHPLGVPSAGLAKLLAQLQQTGWLCQGTVVRRTLRRRVGGVWVHKGPYCLWTGKREGKTVCHALSPEQYKVAQAAIAANKRVMKTLARLQTKTLEQIRKAVPGIKKRK